MAKSTQGKKKKKGNSLLWILLGIVAIMIAVVAVRGGGFGKDEGIEVDVEDVETRTIVETVEASGKIFPEIEVKISSDVSGEIVELLVEEGDSVTQGQLLCRIKPDAYQSALERARAAANTSRANLSGAIANEEQLNAQMVQTRIQLENNETIYNRQKSLHDQGVISDVDLEAAETAFKTSEANLESMKANLKSAQESVKAARYSVKSSDATVKEAKNSLSQTTIFAPNSGIISMLNVEKGERVVGTLQMQGTEILRIANMDKMEVQVEVSENDVLRVKLGDTTDIEVDAYLNRKFTGIVTEIANSSTNAALAALNSDQITNFVVKIRILPGSYGDLLGDGIKFPFRPGMSASVEIRTNKEAGVITVPIQAVTAREDEDEDNLEAEIKEIVFVYNNDTVTTREVRTGIQDDSYIQVVDGLEKGDKIVSGPYSAVSKKLKDGSKVSMKDKDEKDKDKEES
ncbi:MAG: efflux RND transporter periplasmic adaptor subunit [Bacteroidota bacterium]